MIRNTLSHQSINSTADTYYSLYEEEDMKKILLDIRKNVYNMKIDTMEHSIDDLKRNKKKKTYTHTENKELKGQNELLNMTINTMEKNITGKRYEDRAN